MTGPSRRRRHRRSWQRAGKAGLGLAIFVLALELVYRLVALPPDYREQREASLATERVAELRPRAEVQPDREPQPRTEIAGPVTAASEPATASGPAIASRPVTTGDPVAGDFAADALEPGLRINRRLDPAPGRLATRFPTDSPSEFPADSANDAVRSLAESPESPAPSLPTFADPARASAAVPSPAMPVPVRRAERVEGEDTSIVALPVPPFRRPAPEAPATSPLIAVVIDDMGYSPSALARLRRLPGPLTLAFLPYADGTAAMLRRTRVQDFEVMLHLPMEPLGDADPGPEALMVRLQPAELRRRVRWAIGEVPGAVGVNNHMGSRFTVDASGLAIVMEELRRHGLYFLDSRTNAGSLAEGIASAAGLPASRRNVFLDHEPEPRAIARQLALVERIAQSSGNAIAIGHPYPATLDALEAWLPRLERRGFRLARVSEVIADRLCERDLGQPGVGPEGVGWEDCGPALFLAGGDAPILPQDAGEAAP